MFTAFFCELSFQQACVPIQKASNLDAGGARREMPMVSYFVIPFNRRTHFYHTLQYLPLTLSGLLLPINPFIRETDATSTSSCLKIICKFHSLVNLPRVLGTVTYIAREEQKTPILTPLMLAISIQNV